MRILLAMCKELEASLASWFEWIFFGAYDCYNLIDPCRGYLNVHLNMTVVTPSLTAIGNP